MTTPYWRPLISDGGISAHTARRRGDRFPGGLGLDVEGQGTVCMSAGSCDNQLLEAGLTENKVADEHWGLDE